jgi:hypothetical protein
MNAGQNTSREHALPRWYEWLAVVVVAMVAIVYLLIKPAAEVAGRGVGSIVSAATAGVALIAQQAHSSACDAIQHDPQVALLFGDAITCAPLEGATWYDTHGRQELEFSFPISGAQGMPGEARAVVTVDQVGTHLQSLIVTGSDVSILVQILP